MIEDQVPAATKQGDGSLFQLNQIGTRNRPLFHTSSSGMETAKA